MSRYLREPRPLEPRHICYAPEDWADLAEWEESRADHYKEKANKLEGYIKRFIDIADSMYPSGDYHLDLILEEDKVAVLSKLIREIKVDQL